jgi:hypothetical protein
MSGSYDPTVQVRYDGPLTGDFQDRISAVKAKHGVGYWALAKLAGISGGFLGSATRHKTNPINISTATATRLAEVIAKLETAAPGSDLAALFPKPQATPAPRDTIEHALAILRGHGLGVILIARDSA